MCIVSPDYRETKYKLLVRKNYDFTEVTTAAGTLSHEAKHAEQEERGDGATYEDWDKLVRSETEAIAAGSQVVIALEDAKNQYVKTTKAQKKKQLEEAIANNQKIIDSISKISRRKADIGMPELLKKWEKRCLKAVGQVLNK